MAFFRLLLVLLCFSGFIWAQTPQMLQANDTIVDTRKGPDFPGWTGLAKYDLTLIRSEFESQLRRLYDPFNGLKNRSKITDEAWTLYDSEKENAIPLVTIRFAPSAAAKAPHPAIYRTPKEFRALAKPQGKPLQGLRVAIAPGHIGGVWGPMQNRSVYYPGLGRLQEGDLNLITAGILKGELESLGADAFLTRTSAEPVTPLRPKDLLDQARERIYAKYPDLKKKYEILPKEDQYQRLGSRLRLTSEFLFYRCHEIKARAQKIRAHFTPDITVVLYINATPGSGRAATVGVNQNIFFVHGCYTSDELKEPDQALRMLYKLLDRGSPVEIEVADKISAAFKSTTKLPPVPYGDSPSTRKVIEDNMYVVARNLAANREYDGPVVCTEPFFMNNKVVVRRLLAGDYDGERTFLEKSYRSIFREYAQCVRDGLVSAYSGGAP